MGFIMIFSNMYMMYFDRIFPSYHFGPSLVLFLFPTSIPTLMFYVWSLVTQCI